MSSFQTIKIEKTQGITWLRLNRTEKKNAINSVMNSEINAALVELEADDETRVLIVTGSGDSFCAGLDVFERLYETHDDPVKFSKSIPSFTSGWNLKLRYFPKPTIACVNGYCFGGGFNFLSSCDLAIASESAKIGLSEINFAHIPVGGAGWSVAEFLLPKHAMYLILTGDPIDGIEAARIGLVNKAVPADKLVSETKALAEKLKEKHPAALRSAKRTYILSRRLGSDVLSATQWEQAMLHENNYFTKGEWIKNGLKQFKERKIKPGLETYKREEP